MKGEYVLCVPAELSPLTGESWDDFAKRRGTYLARDMAEGNEAWRQLIPYMVFADWKNRKVLAYKRPGKQTESRLANMWTVGVGGHLNDSDTSVRYGMQREALEELIVVPTKTFDLGEIRLSDMPVDRVHLGILTLVTAWEGTIQTTPEVPEFRWLSLEEAFKMPMETWALYALHKIRQSGLLESRAG